MNFMQWAAVVNDFLFIVLGLYMIIEALKDLYLAPLELGREEKIASWVTIFFGLVFIITQGFEIFVVIKTSLYN